MQANGTSNKRTATHLFGNVFVRLRGGKREAYDENVGARIAQRTQGIVLLRACGLIIKYFKSNKYEGTNEPAVSHKPRLIGWPSTIALAV
jgi:hypothetical protein